MVAISTSRTRTDLPVRLGTVHDPSRKSRVSSTSLCCSHRVSPPLSSDTKSLLQKWCDQHCHPVGHGPELIFCRRALARCNTTSKGCSPRWVFGHAPNSPTSCLPTSQAPPPGKAVGRRRPTGRARLCSGGCEPMELEVDANRFGELWAAAMVYRVAIISLLSANRATMN